MQKKTSPLFPILGTLMILAGTYAMLSCVFGGRLSAEETMALPFGFITIATGAMLLTRTTIAVFFLFLYALTLLVLGMVHHGVMHLPHLAWLLLLGLCLPLAKRSRK